MRRLFRLWRALRPFRAPHAHHLRRSVHRVRKRTV